MFKRNFLVIFIIILAAVLRLWGLDKFPAGLNADEAAIGYNDYSLLKTGLDEHGTPWPLVFRSFDDYKPAGYFYLALPLVAVLGLNIWAVRLPSALLGVLSVYFVYLLTNKLFSKKSLVIRNSSLDIGVVAAAMIALSPWHIHFSRGGWEANAASVFMLIGLYFLLKSLLNTKYFLLTTIFFLLSLYTYHSLRVVIPLVFLCFIVIYLESIKKLFSDSKNVKTILVSVIVGGLLLVPLLLQFTSGEGKSRFSGVSVFADSGPLWEALELRREDDNTLSAKVLHNRYATYSYRIVQNYLSHFSPRFLFITGDEIGRNKVPGTGQAYLWTTPFLLLGIYFLIRRNNQGSRLILAWLFISPIAAALTFQSPHALRAQNMVYPLAIITAVGLFEFILFIKSLGIRALLVISCSTLAILATYETARYLHLYYVHYPKELSYAWQYGFDQIASYVSANEDRYGRIVISDRYDQPYILMAFFMKLSPRDLQKAILTPRDKFGFSTVRNLEKMEFRQINYESDKNLANTLIISADEPVDESKVVHTIVDPGGKILWRFIKTNPVP